MSDSMMLVQRSPLMLDIAITQEAVDQKNDALELAGMIGDHITTAAQNEGAYRAAQSIQSMVKAVERSREDMKKPVLVAGKAIDDAHKSFAADLLAEAERIRVAMDTFQCAQRDELRRQEQARAREIERVERERREKEEAARQEAARIESERQAALREAQSAEQRKIVEGIAAEEREKLEARKEQVARDAAMQIESLGAAPEAVKAVGQSVRVELDYEVVDMHLLYKSFPRLVEMKEKRQEIRDMLRSGMTNIPGLRIFEAVSSRVRSKPQTKVIEV